jgi:hypothetical protein
VRGPQGEGAIPVRAPQYAETKKPECVIPSLKVGPTGIAVRVQGRTIAGAPGACPTLPRKDGRHDTEALASMLGEIKQAMPTCGDAQVVVDLPATWGEVAPVLAAVAVDAHYEGFSLTVPLGEAPQAPVDCSGAIELAALSASPKQEAESADAGAPPSEDAGTEEEWPNLSLQSGKSPPPAGSVAIGGSGASNQVPGAQRVVAGMRAGFRKCYGRALAEDPKVAGSIRVTAKIGPNGEVLSVTHQGQKLPETLVTCVLARVSSAQFPPPPGGGAVIVIPISFQPS